MRYSKFETKDGLVNLDPTKGTHWVANINENYFHAHGCLPTQIFYSLFLKERQKGHFL